MDIDTHSLWPTRGYILAWISTGVVGAVACFLPLFNLVGYESAALFGGICGPLVAVLTVHAIRSGIISPPIGATEAGSVGSEFLRLFGVHLCLLIPPFTLLTLNAFRVQNCDFGGGVLFWLAIPTVSIAAGQYIGWFAGMLGRKWAQYVTVVVLCLCSVLPFALQIALQPPITGHQLFIGYFSGSIYDEALAFPASLGWYRLGQVLFGAALLAGLEARSRYGGGSSYAWAVVLALIGFVGFGWIWMTHEKLGIGRDRGYIQRQLGGRIETEHFVIHYPTRQRFVDQRNRLAEDHEFRYAELNEFFETEPGAETKIHSYVYPNSSVKAKLMGGRRTHVAKLWLHEMHFEWDRYGDHMLAHELAHIFTEPFGTGPLRLSMKYGIGINMGLVEGTATAADWPANRLTPDEVAAGLLEKNLVRSVTDILSAGGFWTQYSGQAYMVMGSFVRFLVDQYGIDKFKRAYGTAAFERVYGETIRELEKKWLDHLDTVELSRQQRRLIEYKYDRRTIFQKVCARRISELERRARVAGRAQNTGRAKQLYSTILSYTPGSLRHRVDYARVLTRANQYEEALKRVESLLAEDASVRQRTELLQLKGDILWQRGDVAAARQAYGSALAKGGLPAGLQRAFEAKKLSLNAGPRARAWAKSYFLETNASDVSMYYPMRWYHATSSSGLANYLVGRRLWHRRKWRAAIDFLRRATNNLDAGPLAREARRLEARSLFALDEFGKARQILSQLEESAFTRHRIQATEWLKRVEWKMNTKF